MPYQAAKRTAAIALEDGRIFPGRAFGAPIEAAGEAVFTTCMTGYQEIATDPSFRGPTVCLTYPIIGNYGVTPGDDESRQPWVSALIVRDYVDEPSHWQMTGTLDDYLRTHNIPGIADVDTRALTRHIRAHGLLRGVLVPDRTGMSDADLIAKACRAPITSEFDAVGDVSAPESRDYAGPHDAPHIVVLDCGLKEDIVRSLVARGMRVTVVPHDMPYAEIRALEPDGVLCCPVPATRRMRRRRSRRSGRSSKGARRTRAPSATNCSPWRLAQRPAASPSGIAAAIIRCSISSPGRCV